MFDVSSFLAFSFDFMSFVVAKKKSPFGEHNLENNNFQTCKVISRDHAWSVIALFDEQDHFRNQQ